MADKSRYRLAFLFPCVTAIRFNSEYLHREKCQILNPLAAKTALSVSHELRLESGFSEFFPKQGVPTIFVDCRLMLNILSLEIEVGRHGSFLADKSILSTICHVLIMRTLNVFRPEVTSPMTKSDISVKSHIGQIYRLLDISVVF